MKNFIETIVSFFNTTKLGHTIKSAVVTFTGIFIGILLLNPIINEILQSSLPTINQIKDVWPVVVDAFYRAAWTFFLVEIGIYKYNSSTVETTKPNVIPTK